MAYKYVLSFRGYISIPRMLSHVHNAYDTGSCNRRKRQLQNVCEESSEFMHFLFQRQAGILNAKSHT